MAGKSSNSGRDDSTARLADLQQACHEHGLRLTPQRRALLQSLVALTNHPSAEQLHARAHTKLPGLSRATVFRLLEQLVAKGIIGKACHPGRSARYDVRMDLHHHLVCLRCNSVTDILDGSLDRLALPDTAAYGFEIVDFRVELRGLCRKCRKTRKKEVRK